MESIAPPGRKTTYTTAYHGLRFAPPVATILCPYRGEKRQHKAPSYNIPFSKFAEWPPGMALPARTSRQRCRTTSGA